MGIISGVSTFLVDKLEEVEVLEKDKEFSFGFIDFEVTSK